MANAVKSAKPRKSAGRTKETGNVVVDLGEEIDKKLRSVVGQVTGMGSSKGAAKTEMGKSGDGNYRPGMFGGYKPGGYRPGMFGGYRPWYADKNSLGASGQSISQIVNKPWWMLGGIGLGVVANRALMRVTPDIVKTDLEVVHTGIIFALGVIPLLVRPNSITLGVAIPGAVYFAGSIVDFAMNYVGIKKPALRGGDGAPQAPRQGMDAAIAAREKMVTMQQRINQQPAPAAPQQYVPGQRVSARAV